MELNLCVHISWHTVLKATYTAVKIPINVFLFRELRGLSPNFHIYVSASDLYIPRIDPHISWSRTGRPIVGIYKSLTDTWMWKLGLWPRNFFSGIICFQLSVSVLCSVCIEIVGKVHLLYRSFGYSYMFSYIYTVLLVITFWSNKYSHRPLPSSIR